MSEQDPTGKSLVSERFSRRKSLWFVLFMPLALLLMVSCSLFPLRLPFAIPFLDRFYQGEQSSNQPVLTLTAILQQLTLPSDQNVIPSITPGRLTRAASTQTAVQGQTDQPQPLDDGEGTAGSQTGTLAASGTPRPTGTQTRVPTSTWYIYYFPTRTSVSSNYTRTPTRTLTRTVTRTPTRTLTPTVNLSATSAAETAVFTKQTQTAAVSTQRAAACSTLPDIIAYNADANSDGAQDLILTDSEKICWQLLFAGNSGLQPLLNDWSPDGSKIVFESVGGLYSINADGTGFTPISISLSGSKSQAAWSSDDWIVFRNVSGGESDIYRVKSDGSNLQQLTSGVSNASNPDLSPDGSKVVFVSDRDGSADLYILTIDGEITRLTNTTQLEDTPRWSPDGGSLLFARRESSSANPDIFKITTSDWITTRVDNTDFTNLTGHNSSDSQPDWSRDGSQIVWISDRDSGNDIYVTSSSGGGAQAKINNGTSGEQRPRWKP